MILNESFKTDEEQAPLRNAFLYPRTPDVLVSRYLARIFKQIMPLDFEVERSFQALTLAHTLMENLPGDDSEAGRQALVQDIVTNVELFFGVSEGKGARIQFKAIETDMCRLFHIDNVGLRFLCTYRGPGTQWLDNANVRREGLGKGHNSKIVKDFGLIKNATEFDLLILKGVKLLGERGGAVHRSPPLESAKETRVLLKIDEN